ncbi:MAG: BON domain-containing protein [Sulfuricaulis sp.]|uniref:BON domain-containing protein n=1 Tax=Sulfuricaulis sp. TaxID=2003553 RepID=UPI0025F9AF9C|nr:BON domain-containing protein [Sulfuricaulis sp.]MCR4347584.1 BON domain-containing protein [Sulfuricaulis sp.]
MRTRYIFLTTILGAITLAQGCAPIIIAGGATAAAVATDRRTVGALVDDNAIELKARKALNSDPEIGDDVHVNITSMNGIVLLTGETTTGELRDRALALIRDIPGIRSINNNVVIAEPTAFANRTHDSWITSMVKARLIGTENIRSNHIKVVTESSVVYLMGLVKQKEGEMAATATQQVAGVTKIVKLFEYLD